ncbi:LysE family transporter [Clostridium sp. PL3]|uniref:LysE family transporter n=1 Tax=Clostridium thailandense TaxID=2794346 RepID=A0A949WW35_9CLOT|nr:LysE family transporter [Clostridium thailandense]MBV7274357.1 LysE family transporter [Clostridium thailandense]
MENFTSFLFYVLISNLSPGPNTIISMSNASYYGFKKSIRFNIGIFFGVYIIMALSSIFSVTLYSLIPSIKPIISCIGASYILWLAWKTYKSKPHSDDKVQNHTNTFLYGLLLQFVNPNTIIYSLMTVSTFIVPYYKSVFILAAFSGILAFIGFIATCCWSLFGSVFQKFLVKNDKVINTIMSLLLVYCAVSLFF